MTLFSGVFAVYLEQSGTKVADSEGYGDGGFLALQQRDGVEEDQLAGDHQ